MGKKYEARNLKKSHHLFESFLSSLKCFTCRFCERTHLLSDLPFKLNPVQKWQNFSDFALNVALSEVHSDLLNFVLQEIVKLFPAQGTGSQISTEFLQEVLSQFLFLSFIDTFNQLLETLFRWSTHRMNSFIFMS